MPHRLLYTTWRSKEVKVGYITTVYRNIPPGKRVSHNLDGGGGRVLALLESVAPKTFTLPHYKYD